jgi:hypothetical protein
MSPPPNKSSHIRMKKLIWLILPITLCCTNLLSHPELTMQTHGYLSFEKYIQAQTTKDELYHGYRSELMANINFLRWNRFYLDGLLGNMTIMSHPDSALWNIDRIHYTLNPGFRIEFKNWLIKGALQHDCFHRINQYDKPLPGLGRGSIWWNTYQIGIGSKGAYYLNPQNPFKKSNSILDTWDGQFNYGYYIPAKNTISTGQGQTYRHEVFSQIRYHVRARRNWAACIGLRQHLWVTAAKSVEHKINLTVNLFHRDLLGIIGIYYSYTIYDTFRLDNQDALGAIGIKIVY